jgi:hypothetical protein
MHFKLNFNPSHTQRGAWLLNLKVTTLSMAILEVEFEPTEFSARTLGPIWTEVNPTVHHKKLVLCKTKHTD